MKNLRIIEIMIVILVFVLVLASHVYVKAETINNGSFETANYSGWTLSEDSVVCFGTWGIASNGQTISPLQFTFDFFDGVNCRQSSPGLPITYITTDGNFLAYQLQTGGERHRMYQDVTLTNCATTLIWDMQYTNHSVTGFDSARQFLAVHIRDPLTDGILQTLFKTTQGVDPQIIGMTNFTADISAFAGSTVRIDVDHQVQDFFFDAAFDNFRIEPAICEIEVPVDIKPQSCPNPINTKSKGVLPVAIMGTEDFDVIDVEIVSLQLVGVQPIHVDVEDVGTPFEPFIGKESCTEDCNELGPDGFLDLTMKFDKQAVLEVLGDVGDGDCLVLELTGETTDGTPILGEDVVLIKDKGKK